MIFPRDSALKIPEGLEAEMPGAEGGDLQAGSASPPQRKHPRDPLHGITLERILNQLLEQHGWDEMGRRISIRCFQTDPSVKSSLTFLRKTPWARQKVEDWFIEEQWNRRTKGR